MFSEEEAVPQMLAHSLYSHYCAIGNIYWVAKYTDNKAILESDKQIRKPFIVRSNVENEGYLSMLLPLLFNSTYSFIVDSDQLSNLLPSGLIRPSWLYCRTHLLFRRAAYIQIRELQEGVCW